MSEASVEMGIVMASIKILLVDLDEMYLMPLERKFIDEFENKAELYVITDINYLNEFFSVPQKFDIMIMNETLYDERFDRHNISNVFLLTEQVPNYLETGRLDNNRIYKYTSVKEIFNEVINRSSTRMAEALEQTHETKVIMIYSPIGGIGKTTIATGLCAALKKSHKDVLYMNTDSLQDFGYIMKKPYVLTGGTDKPVSMNRDHIYEMVKPQISKELFDILPPFERALSSLNIKENNYQHLIQCIKQSNDYDFIVVDSTSNFTEETARLMGSSNYIVIIVGQDKNSAFKINCLLKNIDCSDQKKFIFVCNKYRSDMENSIMTETFETSFHISEYVNEMKYDDANEIESVGNHQGIHKLAFTFI